DFPITIATTRPETKLGDTALAVNPKDKRYKKYIGKSYKVNFAGIKRSIKIISDRAIDMKFGTGALGVTPAHSLVDFEMAQKNKLPMISVIDKYGKMNENAGQYQGLKTLEAREKIVALLRQEKLLEKEEKIDNNLSVCYRCNRPIEPILSKQWFVKMSELAKPAIEAVKSGKIKFYPSRWTKVYLDWMENVHDWCISRQIWWGHRLPVWIAENARQPKRSIYVGDNPPKGYVQSTDVLDTWFSSALWPFAVFLKKGKPLPHTPYPIHLKKLAKIFGPELISNDLANFFPTSVLSTARDIIYLWVARMIFSSLEFTGEIPFSKVYIHPTVFNKEGKRMSKSLGTGVDPLELIEKYGTDATRFGLIYQNTGTQDIKFSEETILAAKKFANKLWNAARFVKTNTTIVYRLSSIVPVTKEDKKIIAQLEKATKQVNNYLDKFQFGQAAHAIYDFFWHDFCDIYIEASKKQLQDKKLKENTQQILLYVLIESLKLLHPFMPFITEEIYQNLPIKNKSKSLSTLSNIT
ncbi:MAG: class I tRNA ligase family protein, partial [Patescibacteria group bacterium]|nr:class I tRNA ligase family protein [Patescibacteria group bacterium]